MRAPARRRTAREPTIALINIVFLLLVFFLVAGTLAKPLDPELTLVQTQDLDPEVPGDALVVHADGRLSSGGLDVATPEAYFAATGDVAGDPVRIVPDRALPAEKLVEIGRRLSDAGAIRVVVVTEQALP